MKRNAHMVDLLRPDFSYFEQKEQLLNKRELTEEDFVQLAKNADALRIAAEVILETQYGRKL